MTVLYSRPPPAGRTHNPRRCGESTTAKNGRSTPHFLTSLAPSLGSHCGRSLFIIILLKPRLNETVVPFIKFYKLVPFIFFKRVGFKFHRLIFASMPWISDAAFDGVLPSQLEQGYLSAHDFLCIMTETLAETTHWGNLKTDVCGYVGIDTLQEQIRKKVLKRGFEFNIIVVGRSGLGKSTLINTLFKANVSRKTCSKEPEPQIIPPTTEIKSVSHVLEEKGVRLRLTVTDTPGFGDQINNEKCWFPILEFINDQYEKYLSEEQSVTRKKHIPDTRVHCCIYFIPPTGHSLTPLDIEFMRRLDKCVNIVPVIAKADTLTVEERIGFKQRIKQDLINNNINVYPMRELEEDPDEVVANNKIRDMIPFAVVGSDKQHQVNGRTVYGRKTQWGIVEVENRSHCEFPDLRDMLIRTHMQDLVEVTKSVHYENFRHERLKVRDSRECTTQLNGHQINGQSVDIGNLSESSL